MPLHDGLYGLLVITILSTRHVCTIMIFDAHMRMEDDGCIATIILFKNYGQPHSKFQNNIEIRSVFKELSGW